MPKYLLLNFDIEEFTPTTKKKINILEKKRFEISFQGLEKILKLLAKHEVKSTFFTTLKFAKYNPKIIEDLIKQGHELALHAYDHMHNYRKMNKENAYNYIKKAKNELEKLFKTKIYGFRAPRFQAPDYTVLKKAGIRYDSSLHPTFIPGRYNNFRSPRGVFIKDNITVIPVSTVPLIRFPFSWFWFRNLGLRYAKFCTKLSLLNKDYINIYFHPWEFVDLNSHSFSNKLSRMLKKNTGDKLTEILDKYINFCKENKLKPFTIREYLKAKINRIY